MRHTDLLISVLSHGPIQGVSCHFLGAGGDREQCTDGPDAHARARVMLFRSTSTSATPLGAVRRSCCRHRNQLVQIWCFMPECDLWEEVLGTGISLLLFFLTENPVSPLEQRSLFSGVSLLCACHSHIEKA